MNSVFSILFCIGAVMCCIEASSMDDLKQDYADKIIECTEQFPITEEDVEQLKKNEPPVSEAVKCLLACAYKKTGMMDNKGMLSVEGANKLVEKYFSEEPEKLKKGLALTEACKSVNEEKVSDGDKGCDRAIFIFKCTIANMPALSPDM